MAQKKEEQQLNTDMFHFHAGFALNCKKKKTRKKILLRVKLLTDTNVAETNFIINYRKS